MASLSCSGVWRRARIGVTVQYYTVCPGTWIIQSSLIEAGDTGVKQSGACYARAALHLGQSGSTLLQSSKATPKYGRHGQELA